jgi:hypothetical protein
MRADNREGGAPESLFPLRWMQLWVWCQYEVHPKVRMEKVFCTQADCLLWTDLNKLKPTNETKRNERCAPSKTLLPVVMDVRSVLNPSPTSNTQRTKTNVGKFLLHAESSGANTSAQDERNIGNGTASGTASLSSPSTGDKRNRGAAWKLKAIG